VCRDDGVMHVLREMSMHVSLSKGVFLAPRAHVLSLLGSVCIRGKWGGGV